MKDNLSEKLDSIFQIKIKEDKICTVFRTFEEKIHVLQHQLSQVQKSQQESPFSGDQEKAQKYIERLLFNAIRPINQRLLEHQHALNNIKYNHENLTQNMGEQFKQVGKQFQEHIKEMKARMITEESKLKQDVEVHKIKIDQNQLLFNQFINENSRKERDFQVKIQNIWDVIRSIRKSIDCIDTKNSKNTISIRHTQFKETKENEIDHHHKNKGIAGKNHARERVSILKNSFSHEKNIEYACLLTKVENLEKQIKVMGMNMERQSQKVLTSKRKIGTESVIDSCGSKEDLQMTMTMVENRNKYRSPHPSRFGRSSIKTEEPQNQTISDIQHEKQQKQRKKMQVDIRKANEKCNQLNYKYTLLQENYDIILSKLPRINQIEQSVQAKAEQLQKLRIDLSTLNEIKMRYRKIEAHFQENESKYIQKQTYAKDLASLKESVRDIHAFNTKLAKQDEVKQAFEFIENKIKEIVLLLSDKFEVDRQGAINKVHQIKCLTCDKQVQHNAFHHKFNNTNSQVFTRTAKSRNTNTRATFKRVHTQQC